MIPMKSASKVFGFFGAATSSVLDSIKVPGGEAKAKA